MHHSTFLDAVGRLTGTAAKGIRTEDQNYLDEALADDSRLIDVSQFNELLLLANKDRVSHAFFAFFFCGGDRPGDECAVAELLSGVEYFQKMAMLAFGNFIYGFRQLSRAASAEELRARLGRHGVSTAELEAEFAGRRPTILDVDSIPRDDTYLIGYLSAAEVIAELGRAQVLQELTREIGGSEWRELEAAVEQRIDDQRERVAILRVARTLAGTTTGTPRDAEAGLTADLYELERLRGKLDAVRVKGSRNTDVYLTWDHMDVYFATSMRKRWEYEDLYDFVNELMQLEMLTPLNIRYFDPTQSFDRNRIDKGLVESLMLKRAICTVYSVQDTDTLGKDSELAATLAQGKPVIAYAPTIDVEARVEQLMIQRPSTLRERFQFVSYADENFLRSVASDLNFVTEFVARLDEFEASMSWRSLLNVNALQAFQAANRDSLRRFCHILASSEAGIYNRRARTLQESHPLGIQVNLDTGVANGVLVVRDVKTCGELVRRILTNRMEFTIEDDARTDSWLLREVLTGSVFRVVTKNRKLTNCFWNFYRQDLRRNAADART